jgi:hypothetical protein
MDSTLENHFGGCGVMSITSRRVGLARDFGPGTGLTVWVTL